jgi:hypothetical protein
MFSTIHHLTSVLEEQGNRRLRQGGGQPQEQERTMGTHKESGAGQPKPQNGGGTAQQVTQQQMAVTAPHDVAYVFEGGIRIISQER